MKPPLNPEDFDALQNYIVHLFPEKIGTLCVSQQTQQKELESLEKTIGSQRFFFVVDMCRFEITHQMGISQWLGYSEKDFTLKKYWKLVHPGLQNMAHTVFLQMADILCKGRFVLEFMVQRYSSLMALKHRNGEYLLLKRTAAVFQYDTENRLLGYLNEFTIIGKYEGEPLSPVFFKDDGSIEEQRGKMVMEQVIQSFLGMKIFTVSELQVARILAYDPKASQKGIAVSLGKSPNTINTYYKRFLKKARAYFHYEFATVTDAAAYLRKNGLL